MVHGWELEHHLLKANYHAQFMLLLYKHTTKNGSKKHCTLSLVHWCIPAALVYYSELSIHVCIPLSHYIRQQSLF